jgi:hypothetical protein
MSQTFRVAPPLGDGDYELDARWAAQRKERLRRKRKQAHKRRYKGRYQGARGPMKSNWGMAA